MSKVIVTVIIPTLAEKKRESQLKRCINSIRNSSTKNISIITVVNGGRFDHELCNWLKQQPDIIFEHQSTPSSPLAQYRGRQLVKTPYFSFIDDDDEYLPHAIDIRLAEIETKPDVDFVITNGFLFSSGKDMINYPDMKDISIDPLAALFNYAWLHNCNHLFRTASISEKFFADIHPYAEWTWLAFKLTLQGKRVAVLDEPTFRYYDTPDSLSKSEAYTEAFHDLYKKMLSLSPPPKIVKLIRRRIGSEWHNRSVRALQKDQLIEALIYHLHSLLEPDGLRYLTYSRHLFFRLLNKAHIRN